MQTLKFSKEEKALMVQKVQLYFRDELDREIGSFDAEFLIDFFAEEIGPFFYNRALYEAEAVVSERLADLSDRLLDLERPVSAGRSER